MAGAALGALLSLMAGWIVLRGVNAVPPATTLRAGSG
jgi:hypothetical protein